MIRFNDARTGGTRVVLKPAELYITRDEEVITTVLGSCISVCLWDPETHIAGINHFVLPTHKKGIVSRSADDTARFGDTAMPALLEGVEKMGGRRSTLWFKLFGGAMIINQECKVNCVGEENIKIARAFLTRWGVAVRAFDVGGAAGRRIHFDTGSGLVEMEKIEHFDSSATADPLRPAGVPSSFPYSRTVF